MTERFAALKKGPSHQFYSNKTPKCPHCGSNFDIQDGEAWHLYDDNNTHEVECPDCNMDFQVTSHASWSFSTDEQEDDDA